MEFTLINIQGCNIVRALVLAIGASLSKPHTDKFAVNFLYIYICVSYVMS